MRRYDHGGDIYTNNVRLDFSVNTNPLGMPDAVKRELSTRMDEFALYPDADCARLTRAIAARHGVDKANVLCGNGAADLIFRVCAYLKPKRAVTLAPSFSEYERPAKLFGAKIVEHGLIAGNSFALDESILNSITPDTDIVFLCNPNNPTGGLADKVLLNKIVDRCEMVNAYLMVDECFIEFTHGESVIGCEYDKLLVLRAFTKLYAMAGLRLGYIVGNAELIASIAPYGAEWSVSVPAQIAGVAALSLEPDWTNETRRYVDAERERVTRELEKLSLLIAPSQANFLLIKSFAPLYAPLLERGILVRSCANFTGLDESYIRIGIKTPDRNNALIAEIENILHEYTENNEVIHTVQRKN